MKENLIKYQDEYMKQLSNFGYYMNINTNPINNNNYNNNNRNNQGGNNNMNSLLNNNQNMGQNKGFHCFICGDPGHTSRQCPQKPNITCSLCGRKDHTAFMCWENPRNASRRPVGYVPRKNLLPQNSQNHNNFSIQNQGKNNNNNNINNMNSMSKLNHNIITNLMDVDDDSDSSYSCGSSISSKDDSSDLSEVNLAVLSEDMNHEAATLMNMKNIGMFDEVLSSDDEDSDDTYEETSDKSVLTISDDSSIEFLKIEKCPVIERNCKKKVNYEEIEVKDEEEVVLLTTEMDDDTIVLEDYVMSDATEERIKIVNHKWNDATYHQKIVEDIRKIAQGEFFWTTTIEEMIKQHDEWVHMNHLNNFDKEEWENFVKELKFKLRAGFDLEKVINHKDDGSLVSKEEEIEVKMIGENFFEIKELTDEESKTKKANKIFVVFHEKVVEYLKERKGNKVDKTIEVHNKWLNNNIISNLVMMKWNLMLSKFKFKIKVNKYSTVEMNEEKEENEISGAVELATKEVSSKEKVGNDKADELDETNFAKEKYAKGHQGQNQSRFRCMHGTSAELGQF